MTSKLEWISKQRELLLLEKEAESAQLLEKINQLTASECQELGLSLTSLDIDGTRVGMFGRICLTIKRCDKKTLPKTQFKVGDEAFLYSPKLRHTTEADNSQVFGIISKVSNEYIELVCNDDIDEQNFKPPLRLDLSSSEQTHKKMMYALNDLESSNTNNLIELLFTNMNDKNTKIPISQWVLEMCKLDQIPNIKPFNTNLNPSQIEAVRCALACRYVSLVHGPPGTGKTSTVVEIILQAAAQGKRILVCAPSNVAVDNILERVVTSSINRNKTETPKAIRIGHPARVSEKILSYCLDALILDDEGTELVQDVRKEIDTICKSLSKPKQPYSVRRESQAELKALRKEVRNREKMVVQGIIQSRNIVLCTCVGASSKLLNNISFDMVIIDEAAQALEASCWIPLLRGKKCILAGDHMQLAPTIKSSEAERGGLSVTLFERIIKNDMFKDSSRLLDTQYRMNKLISAWASKESYHGALMSHESVAEHTLSELVNEQSELTSLPVALLLDTSGGNFIEESCNEGSHKNIREAELVREYVSMLVTAGIKPHQIGIITPYNGQLELLREIFQTNEKAGDEKSSKSTTSVHSISYEGIEIRTVDGFQGGEKECIILSLVRSNDRREVGFLADSRRINVAVTRARRQLTVICDADTCSSNPLLGRLINHIAKVGMHLSMVEFGMDPNQPFKEYIFDFLTDINYDSTLIDEENGDDNTQNLLKVENNTRLPKTKKPKQTKKDVAVKKPNANENLNESEIKKKKDDFNDCFTESTRKLLLLFNEGKITGRISVDNIGNASCDNIRNANKETLLFPTSLNSFQRMKIHEIADEIKGLIHQSVGEGSDRYIEVKKYSKNQTNNDNANNGNANNDNANNDNANNDNDNDNDNDVTSNFNDNDSNKITDNKSKSKKKKDKKKDKPTVSATKAAGLAAMKRFNIIDNDDDNNDNDKKESGVEHNQDSLQNASKQKKANKVVQPIIDEDELLNAAIAANQAHKEFYQYRIGSTPMPNPDKLKAKSNLKSMIAEAAELRLNKEKDKDKKKKK